MRNLRVKRALFLLSVLVVAGLLVLRSELTVGQQTPPAATAQSGDLAEAERLNQEVDDLYNRGNYKEAIPRAERLLSIYKSVFKEPNIGLANILNTLALLYLRQGSYSKAENFYSQALTITKRLRGEQHSDVATILNNLAGLYQTQGLYSQAEQLFNQSLKMRKHLVGEVHLDVADSLNNLAGLYQTQGLYSQAEQLFNQSLKMRKHLVGEVHLDVADSLNNLATLYLDQGRYDKAEHPYRQAYYMRKRLLREDHPDIAASLNNLAELYKNQGRYSEAEPYYLDALKMQKKLLGEKSLDVAVSSNNLADLYKNQGHYSEAEPYYLDALKIREELLGKKNMDVASSLNNLALLYVAQERYTKAELRYPQTLEIQKSLFKQHPNIAVSLNNLAELYKNQGRYSEAEHLYRQAIEMQKSLLGENHPDLSASLNNLATLYEAQGNINNALNFLTQGINIQEKNLTYNLVAGFERQKHDYLATISGTTDGAISLHLNSSRNNPKSANLALTTILQRKGRILDVFTNSLQILRQRVKDSESQKLLTQLSNTTKQLATFVYHPPEKPSPEYFNEIKFLEGTLKQLQDKLSRRSAEFHNLSQNITLESVQKLIPSDAALVELVRYRPFNPKASENKRFGEPCYAAYVLTSSGEPQGISLGEADKIEEALKLFRNSLSDPSTSTEQVKQSAGKLDKILMQPVRKFLGKTRKILISPDGTLNLIPFEALVDENNRYLIENYSFNYLTSGRDLLRLQNSFPSKQPPVIIGDPYFDKPGEPVVVNSKNIRPEQTNPTVRFLKDTFPSLEGTSEQAKDIAHFLEVNPLIGSQASEARIKQIQSPKILVIGTHGFFQGSTQTTDNQNTFNDNPLLLSGLIFAGYKQQQGGGNEDGILTAQETTLLNLIGTKLAVLSACDTGVGKDTTGEGIYSLRRALVIAGSESQVISLWKVDDSATKDLMVAYFKRILGKEGRSEALRQTQLEMLRGEQYQHPYYWAAFIPSGDWRPMEH
jgi:CHAT domain-containing protein/Tfp pilus assembly protein PilF